MKDKDLVKWQIAIEERLMEFQKRLDKLERKKKEVKP
jgi:hypothetical protein